jgi:flagellar basal-body rod modification protein FlgD
MATNNIAGTSNTNPLFTSTRDTSAKKTSAAEDMETRFLSLLMTQLKNQDPLNPTDANQMTAQLSQISTVSGIEKLNASMEKLLGSYANTQNMQAAAMIGKAVLTAGNSIDLNSYGALAGINLEGAAESVTVTISDATGKVVQTQELGKQAAGIVNFTWDGQSDAGEALPEGKYTFKVSAANGEASVRSTPLEAGIVSAISLTSSGVSLLLSNNKSAVYSDILQIMS